MSRAAGSSVSIQLCTHCYIQHKLLDPLYPLVRRAHAVDMHQVAGLPTKKAHITAPPAHQIPKAQPNVSHPGPSYRYPAMKLPITPPSANDVVKRPKPTPYTPFVPHIPGFSLSLSSMTYVISAMRGVLESVRAMPISVSSAPKSTFCDRVFSATNRKHTNSGTERAKPAKDSHFVP